MVAERLVLAEKGIEATREPIAADIVVTRQEDAARQGPPPLHQHGFADRGMRRHADLRTIALDDLRAVRLTRRAGFPHERDHRNKQQNPHPDHPPVFAILNPALGKKSL